MKARIQGGNLSLSVKEDIKKQFLILLDKYNRDAALQVLHILHFEFGFGEKRLQKFAECLNQMQKDQKERYELEDDDTPWICEEQLKRSGIDVQHILKGGSNAN
jgi:hypothetical protein